MDEYQLETNWDEIPEEKPKAKQQSKYSKMIDFLTGLSEIEGQFVRNYAQANKGSKLEIQDYQEALKGFRLERAKNFKGETIEEKLVNATSQEAKEKILTEVGINPSDQGHKNVSERDLHSNEIFPDELHSSESIGGYNVPSAYQPKDQKELDKELDKTNRTRSPLGDAMKNQEKTEKAMNKFLEDRRKGLPIV